WLSPLNFRQTQNNVYGSRRESTGKWVLEDEKFKKWRSEKEEILWCPGSPGVGKTVLASYIINHLIEHHKNHDVQVPVLFIYCNYKEQAEQTVSNLIAGLLKQLVQDFPLTFQRVQERHRSDQEQKLTPALRKIHNALKDEINTFSRVFIVVDALDEVANYNGSQFELLSKLRSLGSNLLVTSRYIKSIANTIDNDHRMYIHAQQDDMRKYIEGCILPGIPLHVVVSGDPTLREEIILCVIKYAGGMFLLCRLFMVSLALKATRGDVRIALKDLPKGVKSAYKETVDRICGLDKGLQKIALNAIMLVTYALRPLTVKELQYALALLTKGLEISDDDVVDEAIIVDACSGLLLVDAQRVFRFFHYTTQEYFVGYTGWLSPDPHAELTTVCLNVISALLSKNPRTHGWSETLIRYAAQHWGYHACGPVEKNNVMIRDFLHSKEKVDIALKYLSDDSSKFDGGSTLHLCANFGLARTIVDQLDDGNIADRRDVMNVNSCTKRGMTPLLLAAAKGHVEVVVKQLLKMREVDINMKDTHGRTPLMGATRGGHNEVVKLLLAKHGINVNSETKASRTTPLMSAASMGHIEVVKHLLAMCDVDINLQDRDGWTTLMFAAKGGHKSMVELLLARHDIKVNLVNKDGQTPFSLAASKRHIDVVKTLLARPDVDINAKDSNRWTPLMWAAQDGLVTKSGRSPLSLAASMGHVDVAKALLVRNNVDINKKDDHGWTPLMCAARDGRKEVVKLLLAWRGIDVNSVTNGGQTTPLMSAASLGHVEVVKLIIKRHDVNINSKDRDGRNALMLAIQEGHTNIVDLL
ncbi:hypothetical protein SERLA73DRAFT_30543, partial [Serpula lacrymans var. lacrymans S7.3]